MEATNIFEQAARRKLRFDTPMGMLSAEDLWDLPLQSRTKSADLNELARDLHRRLREAEEVSFVTPEAPAADPDIQLAFDLVKHVIDTKLAEAEAQRRSVANKVKKERLLAIIEQKEAAALGEATMEELRRMAAEL